MDTLRHLCRRLLVRILRIDPHPVARRPRKLNHLRRPVPSYQVVLQRNRIVFRQKRANLHAPPPPRNRRLRRTPTRNRGRRCPCRKCLHPHLRHSCPIHPCRLRRSQRQVDNPPMHKRPTIRNLHHHALIVRQVRHPHHRPQRQRQVRRCHRILVVHLAIRALATRIRRPIPARQPHLRLKRLPPHLRRRRRQPPRTILLRPIATPSRIPRRVHRRRRRRSTRHLHLLMAPRAQQRHRRQRSNRQWPAAPHYVKSPGPGGGGGAPA